MLTETLSKLETLGPVGIKIRTIMNERYDFLNKESNGPLKSGLVRMIDKHKIDYNMMIQLSYSIVATGTTEGQNLIQLAIAIGNRIRNYYKFSPILLYSGYDSIRVNRIFNRYNNIINIRIQMCFDLGRIATKFSPLD